MMYLTAITSKELRLVMRSIKAFLFLFILLMILCGIFMLVWQGMSSSISYLGRAGVSRTLFTVITMGQLICFCFLSPIMTATSISSERENRTLAMLYCTGLTPLGIILGKWISAIGYQLIVVICLLPITSLIFQLGGVGADEYLFVAIITAAAVATYGMVGLAISVFAKKSMNALSNSIVLISVWIFFSATLIGLGVAIIDFIFDIDYRSVLNLKYASILSPVYAIGFGGSGFMGAGVVTQNILTSGFFLGHLAFQAFVFLCSLFIAWLGLARGELIKPIKNVKSISSRKELRKRKLGFPFYLIDPLRKPQRIRDNQDPLVIKERRVGGGSGRNLTALIRMCYAGLGISLLLVFPSSTMDAKDMAFLLAMLSVGIATLIMISSTATLVTREREGDTFDQLLTLPVSEWRIIWSKYRASLRIPVVFVISMVAVPLATHFTFQNERITLTLESMKQIPLILSFICFYSALALFFSTVCRRNVTAIISAFLTIAVLMLAPIVLIGIYYLLDSGVWHELEVDTMLAVFVQITGPFVSPFYSLETAMNHWDDLEPATRWSYILTEAVIVIVLALVVLRVAAGRLARRREG